MDPNLVKYYKLCAITEPREHPVANLPEEVFSQHDLDTLFMYSDGKLIPKERIIGGGKLIVNTPLRGKVIVL